MRPFTSHWETNYSEARILIFQERKKTKAKQTKMNLLKLHYVPESNIGSCSIFLYSKTFHSFPTTSLRNREYPSHFIYEIQRNLMEQNLLGQVVEFTCQVVRRQNSSTRQGLVDTSNVYIKQPYLNPFWIYLYCQLFHVCKSFGTFFFSMLYNFELHSNIEPEIWLKFWKMLSSYTED